MSLRHGFPAVQAPQLILLEQLLQAATTECVHSPTATWSAQHLKATLVRALLTGGCAVLEPGARPREGKLLRLVDDVVRVERAALPERRVAGGGRRPVRAPDLRVWEPERLDVELVARGTFAPAARDLGRAVLDRFGRLASRATDALVLVCDRRSYDALRRGSGSADGAAEGCEPRALAALCAAVLPPSGALSAAGLASFDADVGGGRVYAGRARVTPMVFGVQRVVAAVWLASGATTALDCGGELAQLDAFAAV